MLSYTESGWRKSKHATYLLWRGMALKKWRYHDEAWACFAIYSHSHTHTHTHCSILHASRSVPCGQTPTVSYKLQFLFKHHLCLLRLPSHPHPPPLAQATSNPSTVSHHILVNMIRRKIISNHPDLSLIQVLSRMAGRRGGGWWVANGVKVFGYAGWMHEDNTPAPLPPLSHSVSYIKLIARLVWLWDM